MVPDLTFLIDISPEDAIKRAGISSPDRIESAGIDFQKQVRKTYLNLAKEFRIGLWYWMAINLLQVFMVIYGIK